MNLDPRTKRTLSAIAAVLTALATLLGVFIGNATGGDTTTTVQTHTVAVAPPEGAAPTVGPPTFDRNNNLSPGEKAQETQDTKQGILPGDVPAASSHEDLRDETPPGVAPDAAKKINEAARNTPVKRKIPPAGAQNYSCTQRPVVNRSVRSAPVRLFVLHYTVSGFGSINGIYSQFNNPSSGTSSSLGLELTGQCQQWVPFGLKPWTQLTFNSVSESVEIVAPYDLPRLTWLNAPIFTKGILASIVRDRLRANGLALKFVDPVGCPTNTMPTGWTDHNHLECGNSHTDVGRNFPFDVLQKQITDGVIRPVSAKTRAKCRVLNSIRRRTADYHKRWGLKSVPPIGKTDRRRAAALRAYMDRWKIACKVGPPGKPGTVARR